MARSLAGKTLVCLPFLTLGGWSANASFTRMKKEYRGIGPSKLEFVTGSMDDTIMDTLETGDLIFFSRQLTSLQPLAAIWSFLMRLKYQTRFDHCGFIYVDKLGRKFIVEETFSKVQCRPYSARILTSHAKEIAIVPLKNIHRTKEIQNQAFQFVSENIERPSRLNIRRFVSALFDPSIYPPSTSKEAPLFPAAALIAEAYERMHLIQSKEELAKGLNAFNCTPKDWTSKYKITLEKNATFGSLLPIRLY